MKINLPYPKPGENDDIILEMREYLFGVLCADKEHRLDYDSKRNIGNEIDLYGSGSAAFWRGVIESCGSLTISSANGCSYPRLTLKGSYYFLRKFLDFINDVCAEAGLWQPDPEGKLDAMCARGCMQLPGMVTQGAVRAMYLGAAIGTNRGSHLADEIFAWTPRR